MIDLSDVLSWQALVMFVAGTGAVFFLLRAFQTHRAFAAMSALEAQKAELEAARAKDSRTSLSERARARVFALGYDGDWFPLVAGLTLLYVAISGVLVAAGVQATGAYVGALPLSGLAVYGVAMWFAAQKRRKFNTQLVDMLEMIASQIEGGTGTQRALRQVVPLLPDPLRSEMARVLEVANATRDLAGAMEEVQERYPSQALRLFIAALEIDRREGHAIGPAIRQAANLMGDDFKLRAEANAELSQQRSEFFAIVGLLVAIAVGMFVSGGPEQRAAYLMPMSLIVLGAGALNIAWGTWRMMSLLRKLQGDEEL